MYIMRPYVRLQSENNDAIKIFTRHCSDNYPASLDSRDVSEILHFCLFRFLCAKHYDNSIQFLAFAVPLK